MIICHSRKLIFIKTKKTAGTSFEIALSKFCGDSCVITPITPHDEALRKTLGFRSCQNYLRQTSGAGTPETTPTFYNHMPAHVVKINVTEDVWRNYRKLTIVRNPFDYAISRYYWEGGERSGVSFAEYLENNSDHLKENTSIAPLDGDSALDFYLRYETLQSEFERAGIQFMWNTFSAINAKGNVRPRHGTSMQEMYKKFPEAIGIVERTCWRELEKFGYARQSD